MPMENLAMKNLAIISFHIRISIHNLIHIRIMTLKKRTEEVK